MQKDFWHDRWQHNKIGFHRDSVHPALVKHWPAASRGDGGPVLVPLCGKSLDMHWLAQSGHAVVGVELDRRAVEAFFDEAGLSPEIDETGSLPSYSAGGITIFAGDFFEFNPPEMYRLVYDRAALIALPPDMRKRYLPQLASMLAPGARGLLITLEYPQAAMQGPPFSVLPDELAADPGFEFERLEHIDSLAENPRFVDSGLSWLNEVTYGLTRR